ADADRQYSARTRIRSLPGGPWSRRIGSTARTSGSQPGSGGLEYAGDGWFRIHPGRAARPELRFVADRDGHYRNGSGAGAASDGRRGERVRDEAVHRGSSGREIGPLRSLRGRKLWIGFACSWLTIRSSSNESSRRCWKSNRTLKSSV